MKKYNVVNMQEDEDGFSFYPDYAASWEMKKNNEKVSSLNNKTNDDVDIVEMNSHQELLFSTDENRMQRN